MRGAHRSRLSFELPQEVQTLNRRASALESGEWLTYLASVVRYRWLCATGEYLRRIVAVVLERRGQDSRNETTFNRKKVQQHPLPFISSTLQPNWLLSRFLIFAVVLACVPPLPTQYPASCPILPTIRRRKSIPWALCYQDQGGGGRGQGLACGTGTNDGYNLSAAAAAAAEPQQADVQFAEADNTRPEALAIAAAGKLVVDGDGGGGFDGVIILAVDVS